MGDHHLGKHDVRVVVIAEISPSASVVAIVVSVVSAVVVAALVAEVVDQWTAVDAGVGVVCSSFGLVGARWAGSRSIRRSS